MTSHSDIACDFGHAMTGTNLTTTCAYFDNKKMLFKIFPALLKLQIVFYRYIQLQEKKCLCHMHFKQILNLATHSHFHIHSYTLALLSHLRENSTMNTLSEESKMFLVE